MPRFKDAPVFTIDEKKLEEIRAGATAVAEKPAPKFKSGTRYHTLTYPGYEGLDVHLGISDVRKGQEGLVRVTGYLPERPAKPEQVLSTCPNCKGRFPEGMLVIPAEGKVHEIEVDETHTIEEWEKRIALWGLRVISGG